MEVVEFFRCTTIWAMNLLEFSRLISNWKLEPLSFVWQKYLPNTSKKTRRQITQN